VLGHDIIREAATVRRLVSLTGQFASVDADLTAEENLLLLGRLLGYSRRRARQRADELLAAFGLTSAARHQAARLSGGMRRKLDLAASIIVAPDLLFLDEPTTGLDPGSRGALWEIARELIADRQIIASDEPDPAVISARIPVQQRAGAPGEIAARALARLAGAGIGVSDFALGQPSLDEVFLALTGGHPAPAQPGQAQRGQAGPAPAEKEAAR